MRLNRERVERWDFVEIRIEAARLQGEALKRETLPRKWRGALRLVKVV